MAKSKEKKEPVFIVRSATKMGGLDYFHITLIALVIILVALAFALSTFKTGVVIQGKNVTNCPYGVLANQTCAPLKYTDAQVTSAVGKVLGSYLLINGTLEILPFYALINQSNVSYMVQQKEWFVRVPYMDPLLNNTIYNVSFVLSQNLSLENAFVSTVKPFIESNNSVVALGTVSVAGKTFCTYSKPIPAYFISDPYAPGSMQSLEKAVNITKDYNGSVNMSYYFIFGKYAENLYKTYGVGNTQLLGDYLACTSKQSEFPEFLSVLTSVYQGAPLTNITLSSMASTSGMNQGELKTCLYNSSVELDNEAALVSFYNVTSVPIFIVDCRYQSLPQTVDYAINYTLQQITAK